MLFVPIAVSLSKVEILDVSRPISITRLHDECHPTAGSLAEKGRVHNSAHSSSPCSTRNTCRPKDRTRASGRPTHAGSGRSKTAARLLLLRVYGSRRGQPGHLPVLVIPRRGSRRETVANLASPHGSRQSSGLHSGHSSIPGDRYRPRPLLRSQRVCKYMQHAVRGWCKP